MKKMMGEGIVGLDKEYMFLMNQSEKRLFKRLDVGLEVELMLDGEPLKATTANISCGGLFLMLDPDQIQKDQHVSVVIHLPNRERPVELSANILRREKTKRQGVALQFEGLYNDNILAIEQFIKSNKH
jgi:c-di-GMP-binding flagellar brake protein YcgR